MNKEYILMDLDKLKLITEDLITDVAWPYKLKKIEDLTLSNLFKLNIFVSENKEDCEWHVKNFKISDNLDLQIFDLEEAFLELIEKSFTYGKDVGYKDGFDKGHEEGYDRGCEESHGDYFER